MSNEKCPDCGQEDCAWHGYALRENEFRKKLTDEAVNYFDEIDSVLKVEIIKLHFELKDENAQLSEEIGRLKEELNKTKQSLNLALTFKVESKAEIASATEPKDWKMCYEKNLLLLARKDREIERLKEQIQDLEALEGSDLLIGNFYMRDMLIVINFLVIRLF